MAFYFCSDQRKFQMKIWVIFLIKIITKIKFKKAQTMHSTPLFHQQSLSSGSKKMAHTDAKPDGTT